MNNNSNKIKIYRKNFHRQNCECACVLCTDERLMSYLQMFSTGVCYELFWWDMAWGKKTVLVSGCFGAQWSVGQPFKERVSWLWGVQSDFLSPFLHSGDVKILGGLGRGAPIILSAVLPVHCSLLMSVLVAEPNQTVIDDHRTDSMMAEQNCFSRSCSRLNLP